MMQVYKSLRAQCQINELTACSIVSQLVSKVHDLVLLQIEARVVLAQQEHQGTSEKLAHVEQEKAASQVTYEHNLKQKEVENVNLIKKLEQMQEDREQLKATVTDLEKREGHWRSFVSERNHEGPGAGHPGSRSSVRSGRRTCECHPRDLLMLSPTVHHHFNPHKLCRLLFQRLRE